MPPTVLLTTAEVAEEFGVSVATVNRWVAAGKLKATYKLKGIRGARLFTRRDINALERAA